MVCIPVDCVGVFGGRRKMSECIQCYLGMDKSNAYFECKLRKNE